MSKRSSREKPRPDFPLFRHRNGQWAKKVRGKLWYFGTHARAALAKWLDEKDDLLAGRTTRRAKADELTLRDLANRFLTDKRRLVEGGELSYRAFMDYHAAAARLVAYFGKGRSVADLVGTDFSRYRAKLARTRGPVALGNEIQRVRTIFKFAFDEDLLDRPVRFGTSFDKPSRKVVRKARHAAGSRMIEAAELRRILDTAGQPLRAMILLGLNSAFGQSDVAALPLGALDLDAAVVEFPRPKTAIMRRCPLWPETVAALREAIATRPAPSDQAHTGLVFLTPRGRPVVRFGPGKKENTALKVDAVGADFGDLLRSLKLKRPGLNFYALRHVFRTVADEARDAPATDRIMGHADPSIADAYRERISDARLLAVVNVVRAWLWPAEGQAAAPATIPFPAAAG